MLTINIRTPFCNWTYHKQNKWNIFILISTAAVVEAKRWWILIRAQMWMVWLLTSLSFVPVWNCVVHVDYFIQLLLISQQADVSAASQRYSQGLKKKSQITKPHITDTDNRQIKRKILFVFCLLSAYHIIYGAQTEIRHCANLNGLPLLICQLSFIKICLSVIYRKFE